MGEKEEARRRRHRRVRKKIFGTGVRPRLVVSRSLRHIGAQVVDDAKGHTLVAASTLSPELKGNLTTGGNMAAARAVGKLIAEKALAANVREVVFDRGGYLYHGRVKALAETAREGGLKF